MKFMKYTGKVAYLVIIHILAIIGAGAIVWACNYFREWNKVGEIYSRNIVKIRQGMNIGEARATMGELELDEKYHAKVSYQRKISTSDTSAVIVFSYTDGDHTDGSPVLFVNPVTERVEAIQLGIAF